MAPRRNRPTPEQFDIAAHWLGFNEGDDGEAEACKAVAAWIEAEAFEEMLRSEARKAGIPVAAARRRLAEKIKAESETNAPRPAFAT